MDNNPNIFLTTEDVLYYIFIIYFFTNVSKLYDFYYKNKSNVDAKLFVLYNNGTKYAVNIKNNIDQNMRIYINKIKQHYTPTMETNIDNNNNNDDNNMNETQIIEKKPEIKYEDKYLQEMRNLQKTYIFTEEELKSQNLIYIIK